MPGGISDIEIERTVALLKWRDAFNVPGKQQDALNEFLKVEQSERIGMMNIMFPTEVLAQVPAEDNATWQAMVIAIVRWGGASTADLQKLQKKNGGYFEDGCVDWAIQHFSAASMCRVQGFVDRAKEAMKKRKEKETVNPFTFTTGEETSSTNLSEIMSALDEKLKLHHTDAKFWQEFQLKYGRFENGFRVGGSPDVSWTDSDSALYKALDTLTLPANWLAALAMEETDKDKRESLMEILLLFRRCWMDVEHTRKKMYIPSADHPSAPPSYPLFSQDELKAKKNQLRDANIIRKHRRGGGGGGFSGRGRGNNGNNGNNSQFVPSSRGRGGRTGYSGNRSRSRSRGRGRGRGPRGRA